MKINFAKTFAAILLSTLTSFTAFGANTNWPFPTDPSTPAPGPNPVFELGSCKIITQGLVVIPGNSKDVKNTVQFGDIAKLSSQVVGRDMVLTVVFEGTNTFSKPVTNTYAMNLGVSIGSDYNSFRYDATDAADDLRSVTAELEVTERTKNDVATKALLSTLARSNAVNPTTGANYVRTTTARYMCELKP